MQYLSTSAANFKAIRQTGEFEGYAATYGNVDRGGDIVQRGAFVEVDRTADGMVRILDSHRTDRPVGKGMIQEDSHGLLVKGRLNLDVSAARDVHALMLDGTIASMSIGYDILPGDAEIKGNTRHLSRLKLWEISATAFPMNQAATITSVKAARDCTSIHEFERLARSALGLSGREAKRLANAAWPALQGDDEPEDPEELIAERLSELTAMLKGEST